MKNNNNTIWKIDPSHSEVNFKVKHMMISTVSGGFDSFTGKLETKDDHDFKNSVFSLIAQTDSINTKNKDRDTHLKSDDIFGAKDHPSISFVSKSFDGEMILGDLTIKGITNEIKLDADYIGTAVDDNNQTKAGFEFEGHLSRKDFGINWNAITEAGNIVVSDKVRLNISLQFIKQ